jgi:uncharacterized membrane protein YkgB
MNWLINQLSKLHLLKGDFDYNLVRASMVIIYFFFGYQKWFDYEAKELLPFFTHGPLIYWMYAAFGIKASTYFLGVSEWLCGALLMAGFWNKKLGVLGALGSVATFLCTVTIIPFMPDGWAKSAGGFPAMVGNVAFLMKDLVLLAVSVYLLKQDLIRATVEDESARHGDSLAFASFGEQATLQAERTMK